MLTGRTFCINASFHFSKKWEEGVATPDSRLSKIRGMGGESPFFSLLSHYFDFFAPTGKKRRCLPSTINELGSTIIGLG
jgi:hypothetical protein